MFRILRQSFFVLLIFSIMVLNIPAQQKFEYPQPKKVDQVDDYHGVKVSDPYRWMEEYTPDTTAWIEAENKVTNDYLSKIPERQIIKDRITKLFNYEKYTSPFKQGKHYFYYKNDGLQNQSVLYIADSINDAGRVFLDPNKLSNDGTVALAGTVFSDDGKLVAIGTASAGSDMTEWKIVEVDTGKELPDKLEKRRQGISSFTKDGKGFFYSAFPKPNESTALKDQNFFQKLYYHQLGTPNSADIMIYDRPDNKEYFVGGGVTEDGDWLVISVGKGTAPQNMVYYKNLKAKDSPIVGLIDNLDANYSFIGNDGAIFYFQTDKGATRSKVVSIDVSAKDRVWKEIVPEAKETLQGVSYINNQFVLNYLKDAYTQIKIVDKTGKFVRDVKLPGIGSAGGFGGRQDDTETFYSYSSFNAPPTVYRYELKTGKSELCRQAKVNVKPNDCEVKQVFLPSKDGTKIQMFSMYKRSIRLDNKN
ncbi:MAG TPA: hypothetical protein PKY82_28370, partial [Pyrinomonadaceae bacterium]|nr:hypothetical protein [Pyrinomonadaceae bacterium]